MGKYGGGGGREEEKEEEEAQGEAGRQTVLPAPGCVISPGFGVKCLSPSPVPFTVSVPRLLKLSFADEWGRKTKLFPILPSLFDDAAQIPSSAAAEEARGFVSSPAKLLFVPGRAGGAQHAARGAAVFPIASSPFSPWSSSSLNGKNPRGGGDERADERAERKKNIEGIIP